MNLKTLFMVPIVVIAGLIGASMLYAGDVLMGVIFLFIAALPVILLLKMRAPEEEKTLYKRITESLESVPDNMDYGKLVLTGIKPARYLYVDQGKEREEQEDREIKAVKAQAEKLQPDRRKQDQEQDTDEKAEGNEDEELEKQKLEVIDNVEKKVIQPKRVIQPTKVVEQINKKVSIEVKMQTGEGELGEKGTKEESKVLHIFQVIQKTGIFSKKSFYLYVFHDELIAPIQESEDVIVEGIDIFPITDKHYITSTSPGRKVSVFVEDLGLLGSSRTLLDHLGRITRETLKSNIDHQRRMQMGGNIIQLGKEGVKKAGKAGIKGYKQLKSQSQRDEPVNEYRQGL